MYYLDFFSRHTSTTKEQRRKVRQEMTQELRDEMMAYRLKLQRNICFYCADPVTMADHLDHVIPVYYGGYNSKANLVAACRPCNMTKSTGHIEITNEYTIKDYLKLQEAYARWQVKIRANPKKRRWPPKRVQLYGVYHAHLFKEV